MTVTKKICMIVLPILALILLLLPCTAFASATTQEKEIAQIAESSEKVKTAKCLVYERTCVIALQTEKFTDKSAYDQFRTELEMEILEKYNLDKVIITRNPKIMHAIERLQQMSETEREEAIQKFFEQCKEGDHRPPKVQPR